MSPLPLFFLAVGLATDAFAVAVTLGLAVERFSWRKAGVVGGYFGFFQAAMPLAGYFAAGLFAGFITVFDTWLAFTLLVFLGGKMIVGAYKSEEGAADAVSLAPRVMLPFALATSIDALAVGISFAFLEVNIWLAAVMIGTITFVVSMAGVKIGAIFGERYKRRATLAGGLILILIGFRVLVEGLFM